MEKRTIPRHVDGRVMVGLMPIKSFIKAVIIIVVAAAVLFKTFNFTPVLLFVFSALASLIIGIYSEFYNKESGLDIIKECIRYKIEGTIIFERGDLKSGNIERITRNQIKKRKQQDKE